MKFVFDFTFMVDANVFSFELKILCDTDKLYVHDNVLLSSEVSTIQGACEFVMWETPVKVINKNNKTI